MNSVVSPAQAASEAPDPCPEQVNALAARLAEYLPADHIDLVRRAYAMGAAAHHGQTRKSGEAYITHPVAVATILSELRVDRETLCAAILHDTLEDTPLPRAEIVEVFGESVAALVDAVTKLDKIRFASRQEAAAESFRKMMLAMATDLRVILIKLADRLHNMRTLDAMADEARRRIARETLEIYAPIAQRLGMNKFKAELQDLGFKALYPRRHAVIARSLAGQPVMRREAMATIEAKIAQRLSLESLPFRVVGRVKSPWSIYSKMREEHKTLEQVLDVFGFRVVVQRVMQCYHALGAVHALYKPLEARFRDFIAIPKANGYQSLHTVLFSTHGSPIEVQIRTEEMDLIAERGIAAHWAYKSSVAGGASSAQLRAQDWIRGLMSSEQSVATSSLEFIENVKVDLFPAEVYLFTPKGDILALPRNATALDFAYAVHTNIGDRAVTARVDKKLVPLHTKLQSGQSVEVVTAPSAAPRPQWLEFVVTSKARTAIRSNLKKLQHEDAVSFGHRMLDRALEALNSSIERLPGKSVEQFLAEHRYPRLEALLADIALGNRMPAQVAQALTSGGKRAGEAGAPSAERLLINGSERGVLTFASCCHPVPGDTIMGYLSAGKGIVVHRRDCTNVESFGRTPERCLQMDWDREVRGDFMVALRVEVDNRPGALAQVAAAIAESDSNIDSVEYRERDINLSIMEFGIEVRNVEHLSEVMRRVRRLQVVHVVRRL